MAVRGERAVSTSSRKANSHNVPYEFCPLGVPNSCSLLDHPVRFTAKCCRAFFIPYAIGGVLYHVPDRAEDLIVVFMCLYGLKTYL
jgi:hypothetical protein